MITLLFLLVLIALILLKLLAGLAISWWAVGIVGVANLLLVATVLIVKYKSKYSADILEFQSDLKSARKLRRDESKKIRLEKRALFTSKIKSRFKPDDTGLEESEDVYGPGPENFSD